MHIRDKKYKVFGIVTNMDWDGQALIDWQHKRCGKSEEDHAVMKDDLAGGKLPSGDFGENPAWWWIMIMALNLNTIMKRRVLGKAWIPKRMKAVRFKLINLPGRVLERSRSLIIRLTQGHPSLALLIEAAEKSRCLCRRPGDKGARLLTWIISIAGITGWRHMSKIGSIKRLLSANEKIAPRQRLIFKKFSTDYKNTLHSKLDGGFGRRLCACKTYKGMV
jgi:hypothetical protein